MNVNSSSATAVNQTTNNSIQVNSTGYTGADINASNISNATSNTQSATNNSTSNQAENNTNTVTSTVNSTTPAASTVNSTTPAASTVNSTTPAASTTNSTPAVNNTLAAGTPALVNGLTEAQLKDGLARAQAFFNTNLRLPNYVTYGTRHIAITTFEQNLATDGLKINTTIVNGLTVAELQNGLARAQAFFNTNGRLPSYVTFGTRHVAIATFEQNLATQGLKINTTKTPTTVVKPNTSSVAALAASLKGSTSYNTAVNLFDWVRDNINYAFYYDTKYGAAGTLARLSGNCCDTANLLVALARDDGIPAEYVHGYCDFSSGWYGHVWAQLYVNGKWYVADATSYSNSLGVVKNWNTETYTLEGIYTTLPF